MGENHNKIKNVCQTKLTKEELRKLKRVANHEDNRHRVWRRKKRLQKLYKWPRLINPPEMNKLKC